MCTHTPYRVPKLVEYPDGIFLSRLNRSIPLHIPIPGSFTKARVPPTPRWRDLAHVLCGATEGVCSAVRAPVVAAYAQADTEGAPPPPGKSPLRL